MQLHDLLGRAFPDETIRYTLDWGDENSTPVREPTDVEKTLADIDTLPATPPSDPP